MRCVRTAPFRMHCLFLWHIFRFIGFHYYCYSCQNALFLVKEHSSFDSIHLLGKFSSMRLAQHYPFQFCGLRSILIKTLITFCFSIQTKHEVVWANVAVREK